MRIVELPQDQKSGLSNGGTRRIYRTDDADVYHGPASDFPYASLRGLGITQLALGCCIVLIGLVQLTLSEEDRAISLVSGAVTVWCPLFAISAGCIGMLFSRRRYWDTECMKVAFVTVSALSSLMMVVMIVLLAFVQFYYYDIHDSQPEETFLNFDKRGVDSDDLDKYKAMVIVLVALGGVLFFVSLISSIVSCYFAETYEPDGPQEYVKPQSQIGLVQEPRTVPLPQPQPQVRIIQQPPVQMMQGAPVTMVAPPPSIIPQHVPPLRIVGHPSVMATPPPSLLYAM